MGAYVWPVAQRGTYLTVRITPSVEARFKNLAAFHGRNLSEEVRVALAFFDASATLAYLRTPEGEAETGAGHAEAVEELEADLIELSRRAFARPRLAAGPKKRDAAPAP